MRASAFRWVRGASAYSGALFALSTTGCLGDEPTLAKPDSGTGREGGALDGQSPGAGGEGGRPGAGGERGGGAGGSAGAAATTGGAGGGAGSGGEATGGTAGASGHTSGGGADGGIEGGGIEGGLTDAAPDGPPTKPDGMAPCAGEGLPCPVANPCHQGVLTCKAGKPACVDDGNKANGAECDDGNACTRTDSCKGGACVGANAVTCSAKDQCHSAGSCNTTSGVCSNPAKGDGATCNDEDACTRTDSCRGGACVGTNPIVCTASNSCHTAGTCNPASGACSDPMKGNGSTCSDGNACTRTDSCQGGVCVGSNPVVCTASNSCHTAGVCSTASGQCTNPEKGDGVSCGTNMSCSSGSCACSAGTTSCSGSCVNRTNDELNCGACSHSCQQGTCSSSTCQSWIIRTISGAFEFDTDGVNVVWSDSSAKAILEIPVAGGSPITIADMGTTARVKMANGVIVATAGNANGQVDVWTAIEGSANSGFQMGSIGTNESFMANYGLAINPTGGTAFAEVVDFATGIGTVQACNLGLGVTCSKLIDAAPSDLGSDMIVNASYLFLTHANSGVKRYAFAGGGLVDSATGQAQPFLLAANATHVFWANLGAGSFLVNRTSQASPNATSPEPVIPNTAGTAKALAADAKYLYYGGLVGTTKIGYVPVAGGTRSPLYTGASGEVTWMKVVGSTLYFYDSGDKTLRGIAVPP